MNAIIYPLVLLSVLGAAFGLLLAIAAKVFAVEVDERQELIMGALPGANCGGCGYAGCGGYAAAVVAGEAPVNKCAAGGNECAAKIAEIMGMEATETERAVALVKCSATNGKAKKKYEYSGLTDCLSAMRFAGGPSECSQGCMGLGSCVTACPFDAMHVVDGIAVVDHEACVGCMACAEACPKKIIVQVPYAAQVTVPCASTQKGAVTRKVCEIGCIGCKMCEKACEADAIHVVDNLAYIDYSKCTSCGNCVAKCPRGIIRDTRVNDTNVPVVHKPA